MPHPRFTSTASSRSARRAFTLIEVLVSIAIFAVASTVLYQTALNALLGLESLKREVEHFEDLRFVRNQVLQESDLDTFERGGEITTLDSGLVRWTALVEPTLTLHLFRVELTLEFQPERGTIEARQHREVLFVLRPTWSEPADATELLEDFRDQLQRSRGVVDWL